MEKYSRMGMVVTFFVLTSMQDLLAQAISNESTSPLRYIIYKTPESIIIDGKNTDTAWSDVPWTSYFVDIEGTKKPEPKFKTRAKMLWDDHFLYVYADLEEPHIWATLRNHDQIIYHDNDFEVFIDPDGDSYQYFEIEVNAFETIFDLFMCRPYRNGGHALIPWNADGLKVGVDIEGTINDPSDIDQRWGVEMAIPFKSISYGNHVQVPVDGSLWRINFSRVEWEVEINGNEYQKKTNPETGKLLSEYNWVWSPQGLIDMHCPEKWGYVRFSTDPPKNDLVSFPLPEGEKLKNQLWKVYHSQKEYFRQKKNYAVNMESLGMSRNYEHQSHACEIEIASTSLQFTATLKCDVTGEYWRINEEGFIAKIKDTNSQ